MNQIYLAAFGDLVAKSQLIAALYKDALVWAESARELEQRREHPKVTKHATINITLAYAMQVVANSGKAPTADEKIDFIQRLLSGGHRIQSLENPIETGRHDKLERLL